MSDIALVVRDVLAESADDAARWAHLVELGLTAVGVPEEYGGSGGDLADLAEVVGAVAESGCDLPVAEHAVAAWAMAPVTALPELGTVVLVPEGAGRRPQVVVPHRGLASHLVVAPLGVGPGLVLGLRADDDADPFDGLRIDLDGAPQCAASAWEIAARLAVLRAAAITGAARGAYRLTREHVTVREQFGRPLVRIPAVATALARARVDLVQSEVATARAVRQVMAGAGVAPAAVARVVCGAAATSIAAIAHQLHGALGITQEYGLHPYTRLLWTLRDADQPEEFWAETLGGDAVAGGEAFLWDGLTSAATVSARPEGSCRIG